jgi:hypothetical protein
MLCWPSRSPASTGRTSRTSAFSRWSSSNERDYDRVHPGDTLVIDGLRDALASAQAFTVTNAGRHEQYLVRHQLSPRQVDMVLAGGQIPLLARTAKTPRP